jgi:hypothetical protein
MPDKVSPKSRPLVNRLASAAAHPLSPIQKWTLVALLDHQNKKNGTKVWPGRQRICEITGYKDRATRQALYDLKDLGFINIDTQPGCQNIYYLNLEMIEEQAGRKCHGKASGVALDAIGGGSKCQTPRQEMPDTPALNANRTGNEQSNGTGKLTGYTNTNTNTDTGNRQNGEKEDFETGAQVAMRAAEDIVNKCTGGKHET